MKSKMMDIDRSIHKIQNTIEPLPEMKRELGNNAMSLMEKAHNSEFIALSVKVENEYPTLK